MKREIRLALLFYVFVSVVIFVSLINGGTTWWDALLKVYAAPVGLVLFSRLAIAHWRRKVK
jgi:hypothetical protein